MRISVVTFNQNEAAAVDQLLRDLVNGPASPWQWMEAPREEVRIERPFRGDFWRLDHIPLSAQGNVVAGGELARLFQPRRGVPHHVVFYGCAGSVDPRHGGSVFLVETVNYLSLGTVKRDGAGEAVRLKNKWLCYTQPPASVVPLPQMIFPLLTKRGSLDIRRLTGFRTARVAATDKVVQVGREPTPGAVVHAPPVTAYTPEEWTYGQALDLVAQAGGTVLVEMESYGIASVARALSILERVVVMRVTTDSLENQAEADRAQQELLMDGRNALGRLLARLFAPSLYSKCA